MVAADTRECFRQLADRFDNNKPNEKAERKGQEETEEENNNDETYIKGEIVTKMTMSLKMQVEEGNGEAEIDTDKADKRNENVKVTVRTGEAPGSTKSSEVSKGTFAGFRKYHRFLTKKRIAETSDKDSDSSGSTDDFFGDQPPVLRGGLTQLKTGRKALFRDLCDIPTPKKKNSSLTADTPGATPHRRAQKKRTKPEPDDDNDDDDDDKTKRKQKSRGRTTKATTATQVKRTKEPKGRASKK